MMPQEFEILPTEQDPVDAELKEIASHSIEIKGQMLKEYLYRQLREAREKRKGGQDLTAKQILDGIKNERRM